MPPLLIIGIVLTSLLLITLAISYYCYRRVFYSPPRKPMAADEYEIPPGEIYEEYRDKMVNWMKITLALILALIIAVVGGWLFLKKTDAGQWLPPQAA